MSLLNAWVSPQRALIAVDTDGLVVATGEHFNFSKLLPLAHARTVIAARGDREYLHLLFSYYFSSKEPGVAADYDAIVDHALHAIAVVNQHCRDTSATNTEYQFVIVGWSPSKSRMLGRRYQGETEDVATDVEDIEQFVAPEVPECYGLRPADHGTMMRIARPQSRWLRAQGAAGGGDLVVADLSRSGISIRVTPIA